MARDYGMVVYRLDKQLDALLTQVAAGNPVLFARYEDGSAWWGEPRYAVLIGYDRYKQRVLLRSRLHRRHMMAFDAFASAWAEQGSWAVLVQPPRQCRLKWIGNAGCRRRKSCRGRAGNRGEAGGEQPEQMIVPIMAFAADPLLHRRVRTAAPWRSGSRGGPLHQKPRRSRRL